MPRIAPKYQLIHQAMLAMDGPYAARIKFQEQMRNFARASHHESAERARSNPLPQLANPNNRGARRNTLRQLNLLGKGKVTVIR